jgi:hypothetical protein
LQLTNRAQGNLQCLSLVECPRITDDGLKHVLENNPRLTKVSSHSSNAVFCICSSIPAIDCWDVGRCVNFHM